MASKYAVASCALIVSAVVGFAVHQGQSGALGLNLKLLAPWKELASSADAQCASLWVKHAKNDPALRCYLQTNVARLCDPDERLHLARILRRYRWDAAMLSINTMIAAVKPMTMPVATHQQMQEAHKELSGIIEGKPRTPDEKSALQAITEKRIENIVKSRPATLDAALKVDVLPRDEILGPLRSIAMAGFMQEIDFGWAPGGLVEEAFEGVGAKRSCNALSAVYSPNFLNHARNFQRSRTGFASIYLDAVEKV
jgi:hypothetical protein